MKIIKAKVHRLPTEEKGGCICKRKSDGKLEFVGIGYGNAQNSAWIDNHLYVTTDEEIKEGDYYVITGHLKPNPTEILQMKEGTIIEGFEATRRKIIATTDPELLPYIDDSGDMKTDNRYIGLPQIPQDFIEEYCKAGGIDEVLVEYENKLMGEVHPHIITGANHPHKDIKPKLDNNCIIIHPVEEKMIPLSEVKLLVTMAFQYNGEVTVEFIDKWIEKNL